MTTFTRSHYDWLASYWRQRRSSYTDDAAWRDAVLHMAAELKRNSRSFVTVRFLQACGLTRREAMDMLEGRDV